MIGCSHASTVPVAGGQAATLARTGSNPVVLSVVGSAVRNAGSSDPIGAGTGLENRGASRGAWQVRLLQLPLNEGMKDEGRRMNDDHGDPIHPSPFHLHPPATVAQLGRRRRTQNPNSVGSNPTRGIERDEG